MWDKIKKFFRDSETLFWARLQMALGAVVATLATFDFSSLSDAALNSRQMWLGVAVFGQGVLTEYFRRRRATDL